MVVFGDQQDSPVVEEEKRNIAKKPTLGNFANLIRCDASYACLVYFTLTP